MKEGGNYAKESREEVRIVTRSIKKKLFDKVKRREKSGADKWGTA